MCNKHVIVLDQITIIFSDVDIKENKLEQIISD